MSIDMYVSASQKQAAGVSALCRQQVQGYEQMQKAIQEFTLNSHFLTGKAYDSAKLYFSSVLYPLAQGGILLSEAVAQAVRKLPEEYIAQVDYGDLKQSELEEKIYQASRLLMQAEGIRQQLHASDAAASTKTFQLAANAAMIDVYGEIKRELEEKLQKLLAFNAYSVTIFSEIATLQQAVDQGLAQTKTAWHAATGTFSIPPQEALHWRKAIMDKWNVRQEKIENDITYTVETIETPEGTYYQLIRNGFYVDKEATQAYNELKLAENWEDFKEKLNTAVDVIDKVAFLLENTIKIVGGSTTTIVGIVGVYGSFAVVELASGGTATVFLPGVAVASTAIAGAGTMTVIDGWQNLQDGYQGNVMYANNGKITSKTFGKPIEGRVNGKKSKIRVDAEPDGNKIQIQSGSGKRSSLDMRIEFKDITDKNSIYNLISKSIKKGIRKGKLDELVNNIWKAYIWLKTK